ncbi:S9 family peptidase [Erythrobacter mangrovi]|uniref:S9 family peptidase n=1 Tax=Erythrobacter mangrovi TaxID=2739433 RepID=A0A7D4AUP5_9SPHN|nr:S9 family peptidase [Erythrobacter mangrovi]QKG72097.1 S9 family peptidase [Erythrobacter mangrovi]
MSFRLFLSGWLLLALAVPAIAAPTRPMTADDVLRLETVSSVEISPDGSTVIVTTARMPDVLRGEPNGPFKRRLRHAAGPDDLRDLLPPGMSVTSLGFSPDGQVISFLWAAEGERLAVWGVPRAGGTYRKLAEIGDGNVLAYAWAADGSTLWLIASAAVDRQRELLNQVGFDAVVHEEEPQLNRLFSVRVGDTPDPAPREVAVPGYISALKLLPDGRTAILLSAPSPLVDDSYTSRRALVIDLASGEILRELPTPTKLGDVELSPDGRQLAMIGGIDSSDPDATTLQLADVSTGTLVALNAGAAEAAIDSEWLEDGRLAVIIHEGVHSVLRIYDGTRAAREIDGGDLVLAEIKTGGGRIFVEGSNAHHPNEMFELRDGKFLRWTHHNAWLDELAFGRQRVFRYKARDGQKIEGILIEPVGGIPAGGAPLIIDVHGGPEQHETGGWNTGYSAPGQVAAGRGYAVFLPNYRGSTGYGIDFARQHQGRYTDPEFTDLVDAKRALVAAGIADPQRVGMTGGSYGGYATAWAATAQSEEFVAGVMFVGISNQVSKFGTTDIPHEMRNVHALAWPWDDWQGMLEISPIYYTDRAKTPLLIMHGTEDERVPPGQALELYRAIKVRQPETPLRLVFYPGEGHGNSRAAARYDYNLRMIQWFDAYLKTGDRKAPLPSPSLGLVATPAARPNEPAQPQAIADDTQLP